MLLFLTDLKGIKCPSLLVVPFSFFHCSIRVQDEVDFFFFSSGAVFTVTLTCHIDIKIKFKQ